MHQLIKLYFRKTGDVGDNDPKVSTFRITVRDNES